MMPIKFVIYGEPVSKGRHRTTITGIVYTPTETKKAEGNFRAQAIQFRPDSLIKGPIRLNLMFYRSIPKSFSDKKKKQAIAEEILPVTKPDLDNYIKLVKDAMKGIFWHDDNQVIAIVAEKRYSDYPRIEVIVT